MTHLLLYTPLQVIADVIGACAACLSLFCCLYAGDFYLPICSNPRGRPVASVFLFFTFILVCGYFVMSLNLASVAIGINEKLEELMGMELYGADAEKASVVSHFVIWSVTLFAYCMLSTLFGL